MADNIQQLITLFKQFTVAAGQAAQAARQTQSALNATSGGGLVGTGGLNSSLTNAGANAQSATVQTSSSNVVSSGHRRSRTSGANSLGVNDRRVIRENAKLAKGIFEFSQAASSGDPEDVAWAARGVLKDVKGFRAVGRLAGGIAIGIGAARGGSRMTESFNEGKYFDTAADFAGTIAQGAAIGGPYGAALAAAISALSFAYGRNKPSSLQAFLRDPLGSLGGESRDNRMNKFNDINRTVEAFANIYGAKKPNARAIDKAIDDGVDPDKIKEKTEKAGALIDSGYQKIGMGLFGKGTGDIEKGYSIMKKTGLLSDTPVINPAQIYMMLESQRFAVKNYAMHQMARAGSRTGD